MGTFSVVSAGHDCVGLLVGWFWCEAGVKLEIEPWRAVLAIRFLLLRLDWREEEWLVRFRTCVSCHFYRIKVVCFWHKFLYIKINVDIIIL